MKDPAEATGTTGGDQPKGRGRIGIDDTAGAVRGDADALPARSVVSRHPSSRDRRDLITLIGASVLFFCAATAIDLRELIDPLFARLETYAFDDLFLALVIAPFPLAWLAWRRWCDARDSEARYRDVVEYTSDWIYGTDANLRYTYVTGRFSEVTGLTEADWLGKRMGTLADPTYAQDTIARSVEAIERHEPIRNVVVQVRSPGGSQKLVSVSAKPIFSKNGRFEGYHGAGSDVTKLQQISTILIESRERERMILASAGEGIVGLDGAGRCTSPTPVPFASWVMRRFIRCC